MLTLTDEEVRILDPIVRFEYERVSRIADQSPEEVSPEAAAYVDALAYFTRRLEIEVKRL